MCVVITSSPRLLLRPAAGRHHRTSRAGWSTLLHRRHEIAVDLHQVRMAYSTSPALAAVCRRSRGSVRFHWGATSCDSQASTSQQEKLLHEKIGARSGTRRAAPTAGRGSSQVGYGSQLQAFWCKVSRACRHSLQVQGQPGLPPQPSGSGSAGHAATGFPIRWAMPAASRGLSQVGHASQLQA